MEKEDPILMQAANAAKAKLPHLIEERDRLDKELHDIITKINQYKNIMVCAGVDYAPAATQSTTPIMATTQKKATKGSCMEEIDISLTKQPITTEALRESIKNRTGVEFGISTLYINLKKGKDSGKYLNDNGRWLKA